MSWEWEAPLPPPSLLQAYDDVCPGAARAIVEMAQDESRHAREVQNKALAGEIAIKTRGQRFALTIALVGIGSAVWLAMAGHSAVAMVIGGATLASIAVTFIVGKHRE